MHIVIFPQKYLVLSSFPTEKKTTTRFYMFYLPKGKPLLRNGQNGCFCVQILRFFKTIPGLRPGPCQSISIHQWLKMFFFFLVLSVIAAATRRNIKGHDCSKVLQLFLNNNLFVKICP